VRALSKQPCSLVAPAYTGAALTVEEYMTVADPDGLWPQFVDPAGFVLEPGTGEAVELEEGGRNRRLEPTHASLSAWLDQVTALWLGSGVALQMAAFRRGVEEVFPVQALKRFTAKELQTRLAGDQHIVWTAYLSQDWLSGGVKAEDEAAALEQYMAPIGRLNKNSPVFKLLVEALVLFDNSRRAKFLDLVCSNPRLPPGGLPQAGIKVAARPAARGARVWAQTCARTLYLPDYATAEALKEGLDEAFANMALGGFHEKNLAL